MNLLDVLTLKGVPFKRHTSKPEEVWLCCPFCEERHETPDTRYRLGINVYSGYAHCWNCEFASRSKSRTFQELSRVLALDDLDTAAVVLGQKAKPGKVRLPEDFEPVKKSGEYWNNVAYQYLQSRGLDYRTIREKSIGYSLVGPYAYRVIVPIHYRKKLVGLVGRALATNIKPKYKNSVGVKAVFNVPEEPQRGVVLTEGVFDALAVERASRDRELDSCAILGHTLTDLQLKMLAAYKYVYLWPDPDKPGVLGFLNLVGRLQNGKGRKVLFILPGMDGRDPSEYEYKEILLKLKAARPATGELDARLRTALAFEE